MTHDELLARLELKDNLVPYDEFEKRNSALRAVVELHKERSVPVCDDTDCCGFEYICKDCEQEFPCLTIQAIEKGLA